MSASSQPVLVTVPQGASQDDLAAELKAKGLIRDQQVFLGYLRWMRVQGHGLVLRAGQFQLDFATIAQIASTASEGAPADCRSLHDRLWDACVASTRPRLENLAQRIDARATWADARNACGSAWNAAANRLAST